MLKPKLLGTNNTLIIKRPGDIKKALGDVEAVKIGRHGKALTLTKGLQEATGLSQATVSEVKDLALQDTVAGGNQRMTASTILKVLRPNEHTQVFNYFPARVSK